MKHLKSIMLFYVLPFLAVLLIVYGCGKSNNTSMRICQHQYALCTSALCVPQPGDPTKAICFCDVEEGKSMSTTSCSKLEPSMDSHGLRTVYSTFSLKQFSAGLKSMKCPSGTPWTWCLNKRCIVDPSNPQKATCICDVMRTGEWTTLGGNCDTSTCKDGYWSGATIQADREGSAFMMKALGLDQSPAKWCQVVTQ